MTSLIKLMFFSPHAETHLVDLAILFRTFGYFAPKDVTFQSFNLERT